MFSQPCIDTDAYNMMKEEFRVFDSHFMVDMTSR